jgi:hypothetical protein
MTDFSGCFAEPSENGRAAAVSRRYCYSQRQKAKGDCMHRAFGRHCFGREDQNSARRPSQFKSPTRRRRPAQSLPRCQIRKEVTHLLTLSKQVANKLVAKKVPVMAK